MLVERPLIPSLWTKRELIWRLARSQVRDRYASTALGTTWALAQPAVMLFVYWFIFEYGLRMPSSGSAPFVLLLITGLVPWLCFSEMVANGSSAVISQGHLVKKIAFPLEILPAIPITAAAIIHAGLLGITFAIVSINGFWPTPRLLILVYAFICLVALAGALAYLTSALNAFQSDVGQITGLLLQLWFWMTPIVWSQEVLSAGAQAIIGWNPMTYVLSLYRAAFLPTLAMPSLVDSLRFWVVVLPVLMIGLQTYRRLKHHFADVL
ncbi:ABC transporter permease [Bosea sp. (in: a-proteobacteria)]|jgi:ABC-type polysaccharide/polyol phosphate export permease|uniref:ABC transporter permease n=1 Tax=Bosea sp. (in: a-proteobacteria) TaxID=1871050 RepID=UPI002DDCCF5A|nr:ABC transporter permease [Bosea sp. (in: a-proteobacteria)]HEV2508987.1 ABC transporter permease [Bosea sp. (in: a-proteobacteria)]